MCNFTAENLTYFCKGKQHKNISVGADSGNRSALIYPPLILGYIKYLGKYILSVDVL